MPDRPTFYIPVAGTRGWNDRGVPKLRWWQKDSDFVKMMASLNCIMCDPDQPFVWTTDLNGAEFWRRWKVWGKKPEGYETPRDHRDWVAGGENFIRYCDSVRGEIPIYDRNVISHSHGFQVVAYAARFGLKIRRLLSIAPPYRHDMESTVKLARPNIERWILIIDTSSDRVADLGAFGDGILRRDRFFDCEGCRPDLIIKIPEIHHSRILNDRLDLWKESGLADHLR